MKSRGMLRILYGLVSLPFRLRDYLYCRKLRWLCTADDTVQLTPQAAIHSRGPRDAITIGCRSLIMGELLLMRPESRIHIGEWSYIGPDAKIWALERIDIGARVFISHGVQVFDNNSHSISANDRHARFQERQTIGRHLQDEPVVHRPIRIEDDVWIGFNAALLKGVTVGKGSIVGACAVVTHDVPPYTIVAGNPAHKVGESRP
jgi:acetyltransferase-like isoleucine patch superfamily enzyme